MKKYITGAIGAFAALTIFGSVSFATTEGAGAGVGGAVGGAIEGAGDVLQGAAEGAKDAAEGVLGTGEGEGEDENPALGGQNPTPENPEVNPEAPDEPDEPDEPEEPEEPDASEEESSSPTSEVLGEGEGEGATGGNNPTTGALETAAFGAFALGSLAIAATARKKR